MPKAHTLRSSFYIPLNQASILSIGRKRNARNFSDYDGASSLGSDLDRRRLIRDDRARRVVSACASSGSGDVDDVTRTESVLRQAAVVLDNLFDCIEVGNIDF